MRYVGLLTGYGIPSGPRASVTHLEGAEPPNDDRLALGQSLLHFVKNGVDGVLGFRLADSHLGGNTIRNVDFLHRLALPDSR